MNKHFTSILMLLLCLLVASPVEARLKLGVLVGTDEASGEITSEQVRPLASMLAEKLQEEVVVKEVSDSATLINWLDRFATLDLALLSANDVESNRGRFLLIGQFDELGKLSLVARQGIVGDLPQLVAQTELQDVPSLRPGRSWDPQKESVYRDILPSDEPLLKNLVIGVVPDPGGLLRTSAQAESLAAYLEEVLPVSVKIREFTRLESFTAWFMRHRMIDIAVLSPAIAKANLGRGYQPVVKLFRTDRPGEKSAELVVLRHDQSEEVRAQLQGVFLDMAQTVAGQALLAELKISGVFVPDGVPGQAPVVAQAAVVDQPQKRLPPPVYAEPVEPLVPLEIIVKALPELLETVEATPILSVPEMSDVAASLPVPATAPVEPPVVSSAPVVELKELAPRAVPDEPVIPVVPPVPQVVAAPKVVVPVEPPVVSSAPVVEPKELVPRAVPGEPVIPVVPPVPQVMVAPELVAPVEPPVVSAVSVVEPEKIVPEPVAEEPVIAAPSVPQVVIAPEPVALPEVDQPEMTPVVEAVVPREPELPVATSVEQDFKSESVAYKEQQKIIEEVMEFAEVIPAQELAERNPLVIDENEDALRDDEILFLLGEDTVAAVVAQPDIPPELRPHGIPVVRPGRITRRTTAAEDELLVASMPEPRKKTEPAQLPKLLPESEPEPGIIYVVPFAAVMVPGEVRARIFDQFVDTLNQKGEVLGLQFVILKKRLQKVDPEWLAVRKYVTGEIYAYVEDSGSNWTELRSKARLAYRSPDHDTPAFDFEYPVKRFFDHDRSTIDIERIKLSDDISATLSSELLKALQN